MDIVTEVLDLTNFGVADMPDNALVDQCSAALVADVTGPFSVALAGSSGS